MILLVSMLTAAVLSLPTTLATEVREFDRAFPLSGSVQLDVMTKSGGISVVAGSSNLVRIRGILKAELGASDNEISARIKELERNPPVELRSTQVRIGYVNDPNLLKGISMYLEIQAPQETQVQAYSDSGEIQIQGVRGPADCRSHSGSVELNDIGSSVRASADSGGITITHINGSAFIKLQSGGINATDIAGRIDAETDSGGIRLSQSKPAPISARADSGDINIKLAPGASYEMSIASEMGHIFVPAMTVEVSSPHHVEGRLRGGGPQVTVHVESGEIRIE